MPADLAAQEQDFSFDEYRENDRRVYGSLGWTNTREMDFNTSFSVGEIEPDYAWTGTLGYEQDVLFGFGFGLELKRTSYILSEIAHDASTSPFFTQIDKTKIDNGSLTALSIIPSFHYRLENDVLEPYISAGVGTGLYSLKGTYNYSSGVAEVDRSDVAVVLASDLGVDYIREDGITIGLVYDFQVFRDVYVTRGAAAHTLSFRVGREF